jgi:hypothetical protein
MQTEGRAQGVAAVQEEGRSRSSDALWSAELLMVPVQEPMVAEQAQGRTKEARLLMGPAW